MVATFFTLAFAFGAVLAVATFFVAVAFFAGFFLVAVAVFFTDVTLTDFFWLLAAFFFVAVALEADFFADLPPNAASHPSEYAPLVPTRRIVIDFYWVLRKN
ncbi:hypothetical protein [Rubripirellula reticaptiva]|uniref:hypothetical protein n=1 Tax=Rubripirellula reticaptiva TaxID=2528013 RepID=UPI00164800A9|nr:hypothetical protein [Rubripirellula reticaptiva]